MLDDLRKDIGARLEAGDASPWARAASSVWARFAARAVRRELRLPSGLRVIGVGGASLGGAGKTPLAIALARAFAENGASVAIVGHAYRAAPRFARRVLATDSPLEVGDDALLAARSSAAPVFVAPRREQALLAARAHGAAIVILDGVLQTKPLPLASSILAVDAAFPWASAACPPAGDLRAPRSALLEACSIVASIADARTPSPSSAGPGGALRPGLDLDLGRPVALVPSLLEQATDAAGEALALTSLRGARVGLLLGVARPERVLASLANFGVYPAKTARFADHARFEAAALERLDGRGLDLWLTTGRCAVKLPPAVGGVPVLALDHRLDVSRLSTLLGVF